MKDIFKDIIRKVQANSTRTLEGHMALGGGGYQFLVSNF